MNIEKYMEVWTPGMPFSPEANNSRLTENGFGNWRGASATQVLPSFSSARSSHAVLQSANIRRAANQEAVVSAHPPPLPANEEAVQGVADARTSSGNNRPHR